VEEDGESFAPERLTLIRERRGFSVAQLARVSGVADKAIRNAEAGTTTPSDASLSRLAVALEVPEAYFFGPEVETLGEHAASFRKASKLPAYRRKAALAAGSFAMQLAELMSEYFDLASVRVPDLGGTDPETAAEAVRAAWGLGSGPAPNLVHLLESKGVFVTALAEDCRELDAFSFWRHGRPFVVLNTQKSGERGRMDAAHELAHLVLHRDVEVITKEHEAEAQTFGGSFLLPRSAVLATGMRNPRLGQILEQKAAWQVAATLFVKRLHDVGLLGDWAYRTLMIELSQRGYRSGEPGGIPRETSQFLNGALTTLRAEGTTTRDLAADLRITVEDLRDYMFGLVLQSGEARTA
jgi:Zn-dependent peptidase ImmA (M78 family)/transcriptional regulator with XRE-family HTH domain